MSPIFGDDRVRYSLVRLSDTTKARLQAHVALVQARAVSELDEVLQCKAAVATAASKIVVEVGDNLFHPVKVRVFAD